MEYIIALLVIALIVVLFVRTPNKVYDVIISTVIESLQNKEGEIVYGIWNKLPQNIKDKVDSKTIAMIVSFTIGIVVDILGKKDTI